MIIERKSQLFVSWSVIYGVYLPIHTILLFTIYNDYEMIIITFFRNWKLIAERISFFETSFYRDDKITNIFFRGVILKPFTITRIRCTPHGVYNTNYVYRKFIETIAVAVV